MGRLTGKVAIVTGAASRGEGVGNGAATAILFAREGAKVVLVNRDLERAKALEERIRAEGGEATAFAADVTQPDAAEAMAAFAVERYGRLDILHNNVGIGGHGYCGNGRSRRLGPGFSDQPDLRDVVLPRLHSADARRRRRVDHQRVLDRGHGRAVRDRPARWPMRHEGRAAGPDAVGRRRLRRGGHPRQLPSSAPSRRRWSPPLGEEGRERRRKAVPLQTEGTGWDVAYAAVYLASDESRWVTGVMLPIDGGFLAVRAWPR